MRMPKSKKKSKQAELEGKLSSAMMHSPIMTPADVYAVVGNMKDGVYKVVRAVVSGKRK